MLPVGSSYLILIKTRDNETGVRKCLAGTLVQDTGVGESDGFDVLGGQEGSLAAILGQV